MPYYGRILNRLEFVYLIVGMITVYAGLWYLTGDVGYEAKIILFIAILLTNGLFGIMWIKAYLGHAEWAEKLVKTFRTEKQYIKFEYSEPYFHENNDEAVPFDKNEFLRNMLLGKQFYTAGLTLKNMEKLM